MYCFFFELCISLLIYEIVLLFTENYRQKSIFKSTHSGIYVTIMVSPLKNSKVSFDRFLPFSHKRLDFTAET